MTDPIIDEKGPHLKTGPRGAKRPIFDKDPTLCKGSYGGGKGP